MLVDDYKVIGRNITSEKMKMHQLSGGVVIAEKPDRSPINIILDYSKIKAVYDSTLGFKKVVIIYKFTAELELIQNYLKDAVTTDLDAFIAGDIKILCWSDTKHIYGHRFEHSGRYGNI